MNNKKKYIHPSKRPKYYCKMCKIMVPEGTHNICKLGLDANIKV